MPEYALGPPDWDALFALAEIQAGLFTTAQAASSGYSRPLLQKHLGNGRFMRVRRGIYRVVHYPATEYEDLAVFWLWSDQVGVFSHETALMFLELSDVLPAEAHMTVPEEWRTRRLKIPEDLVLHYGNVSRRDREWLGPVPMTSPRRTLLDCIDSHVSPELVEAALEDARTRNLISRRDAATIAKRLAATTIEPR